MHETAAKTAVIAHLLFTLASLVFSIVYYFTTPDKSIVPTIAVPIWMGYTVYSVIRSVADLIGQRRRFANFTRMLDRWENTFENKVGPLVLLAFVTLAVGGVKLAVPYILSLL